MNDPELERLAPYMDLSDQALALIYGTILHANLHKIDRPFSEWDCEDVDVQALRAVILSREGLMDRIAPQLNRQERRAYIRRERRRDADGR